MKKKKEKNRQNKKEKYRKRRKTHACNSIPHFDNSVTFGQLSRLVLSDLPSDSHEIGRCFVVTEKAEV